MILFKLQRKYGRYNKIVKKDRPLTKMYVTQPMTQDLKMISLLRKLSSNYHRLNAIEIRVHFAYFNTASSAMISSLAKKSRSLLK